MLADTSYISRQVPKSSIIQDAWNSRGLKEWERSKAL
jgi:hypothetical protein